MSRPYWKPPEASAVKIVLTDQWREAGLQYMENQVPAPGEKGRLGHLATWEGSRVGGGAPVVAVFVRGLHILCLCKGFPWSSPLVCLGDQEIEQRLWVGRA